MVTKKSPSQRRDGEKNTLRILGDQKRARWTKRKEAEKSVKTFPTETSAKVLSSSPPLFGCLGFREERTHTRTSLL